MRTVVVDAAGPAPFAAWRAAARALLAEGVPPEQVAWRTAGDGADAQLDAGLLDATISDVASAPPEAAPGVAPEVPNETRLPRVPRRFVALGEQAACHADADRWPLLYRVLWRLTHGAPALLEDAADPDVARLGRLAKAVAREEHKCHAFVRFRAAPAADGDAGGDGETFVAWFEPVHDVLVRAAPFFVRRFPNMRWAILSPRRTVRWDGATLHVAPGVPRTAAPADDALEELWRTYYAHVFNPARVKTRAMKAEMAVRYWANLPEAALIPSLVREAPARVRAMVAREAAAERTRAAARDAARDASVAAMRAASPAPEAAPTATPGAVEPHTPHAPHTPSADDAPGHAPNDAPDAPAIWDPAGDAPRVAIGTASWTDPTLLVPGLFYPRGVSTPDARLRFYAARYPMVEVDSTYYALPTRRVAELWAERTPAGFTFDVKAHALLTGHPVEPKRLPRALRDRLPPSLAGANRIEGAEVPDAVREAAWTLFLDALQPLVDAGKLRAILLQWPRDFRPTRAAADALAAARERLRPLDDAGVIGAIEFRHREWYAARLQSRTLALLERLELAHVTVDAPPGFASSVPWVPTPTHPRLALFRLHGRRTETWERAVPSVAERYRYRYDARELAGFAADVADVAQRVQGTHVVFNNCHGDFGVRNAAELASALVQASTRRRGFGARRDG